MRERPAPLRSSLSRIRITPAYAGKTSRSSFTPTRSSGSPPRMRERLPSRLGMAHISGDHPRVCGKDYPRGWAWLTYLGITPAYAGKTADTRIFSSRCWDHPRVCGKDGGRHLYAASIEGSPPRMRERQGVPWEDFAAKRITPAYAGKTGT